MSQTKDKRARDQGRDPAVQVMEQPAGPDRTGPAPAGPLPENFGDRLPKVGDAVWYWYTRSGKPEELIPSPATLLEWQPSNELWSLNVQRWSLLRGHRSVRYSDMPKPGCWSWPE